MYYTDKSVLSHTTPQLSISISRVFLHSGYLHDVCTDVLVSCFMFNVACVTENACCFEVLTRAAYFTDSSVLSRTNPTIKYFYYVGFPVPGYR